MCITSNKKKGEKTLDPRKSCEIQKGAGKASRQSSTSPTIFLSVLRIYVYIRAKNGETGFRNSETGVEQG